jgi:hypothetical protein
MQDLGFLSMEAWTVRDMQRDVLHLSRRVNRPHASDGPFVMAQRTPGRTKVSPLERDPVREEGSWGCFGIGGPPKTSPDDVESKRGKDWRCEGTTRARTTPKTKS